MIRIFKTSDAAGHFAAAHGFAPDVRPVEGGYAVFAPRSVVLEQLARDVAHQEAYGAELRDLNDPSHWLCKDAAEALRARIATITKAAA